MTNSFGSSSPGGLDWPGNNLAFALFALIVTPCGHQAAQLTRVICGGAVLCAGKS